MNPIGLDIGGANLKASDRVTAISQPFPLWKEPQRLAEELASLLKNYPADAPLAVTMTGELADCFETKSEGVHQILNAVEVAGQGRPISVWQTGGEFVSVDDAHYLPELVAAANWHALATWAGRMRPLGESLLIDIGSTTTDIIPIHDGLPETIGLTDRTRLENGELLYLGVQRTPLACLVGEIEFQGAIIGLARELFATTLDVHLILGELREDATCHDTANGRPTTIDAARTRLSRMLCTDREELSDDDLLELAQVFRQKELELVRRSLLKAWRSDSPPRSVLVSGAGEFLAREALNSMEWNESGEQPGMEILSLTQLLGENRSKAACADALSQLASEL
ncbi:MAG TPA: hydantoinase/oxoprolinase family protein [Planctomicrobium sp.]|nr:hydantoinase/oxoprolinase family protein [Planctomicrobium sp.]